MKGHKSNTPTSEKDFAQTPEWFIRSLEHLCKIRFDLDVCAQQQTTKAADYFSLERGEDGLNLHWRKTNWCNPPFSNITAWMVKAVEESKYGSTTYIIHPDAPETAYNRFAWANAETIIRMPFRIKFKRPDGTPFTSTKGIEQSPQFACCVSIFVPLGGRFEPRVFYYDFRDGFYVK